MKLIKFEILYRLVGGENTRVTADVETPLPLDGLNHSKEGKFYVDSVVRIHCLAEDFEVLNINCVEVL